MLNDITVNELKFILLEFIVEKETFLLLNNNNIKVKQSKSFLMRLLLLDQLNVASFEVIHCGNKPFLAVVAV